MTFVFKIFLDALASIGLEASTDRLYTFITGPLYLFGLWGIFRKCGIKGWWAFVPVAREFKLGKAAGREAEGRVVAVIQAITVLLNLCSSVSPNDPAAAGTYFSVIGMIQFLLLIVALIYSIRVDLGLIEVFDRKKRWILLWIIIPALPAMLWGWMKKYQPLWTVQANEEEVADFFSGKMAEVLDNGLTVNLEERSATQMFKKKVLLRDIHMYIPPGHLVLLLGGSGAGKTTFVNAVNGYEKARAEVMLNGRNMYKDYKNMKYDIGFVPQADLMRGSDSVHRTLTDAAAMRLPSNFSKADRMARVDESMRIFGLTPVKNSLVSKLSGGQKKRLSIAMEFISNPTLFILDEPDSGLDGVMARELFQQLRMIADQGKIIIVITHTPDRVIDLFDDVIVLAKDAKRTGRLAFYGPVEEARQFFGKESMEEIVKAVNREEEGGEGRADEFVMKFVEVQHA